MSQMDMEKPVTIDERNPFSGYSFLYGRKFLTEGQYLTNTDAGY